MHLLLIVAALPVKLDPHNLIWISGVVGFLLPHAIALLNQTHWSAKLKSIVAFCCCLIAAIATTWIKGDLNFTDVVASAGTIFVVARSSYAGLWKPTGIAPTIEAATSASPGT